MTNNLTFNDKIGVLDPEGKHPNPLTGEPYSDEYKKLGKIWSTYPTYLKAKDILSSIANNQVTIVISQTGSGKSLLVPKLALHYFNYNARIAMTLPKRIITLSAATFNAKTLDVPLGKDIGYQYKGSPKEMANSSNKIIYMTDGILTMKFVNDPTLSEYNVIIIDEAHERRIQIDLILLFLKNLLLSGKRPDLRVIIMSATIDPDKHKQYMSGISTNVINIGGLPNHGITTHFLDNPTKSYMTEGLKLIDGLIGKGIKRDILFFITSSNEALQACKTIRPKYPKVYCIEVYADMDKNLKIYVESRDKFLEIGNYEQRLIISTNVAESSLTIDGLKYVIDSGYELYSYFDPNYIGQVLEKRLISKAQALQRRGRVGRTEAGVCFTLLTEAQFNALEPYPAPDIIRQDITMDILKIMQLTDTKTFDSATIMLNQLMDPPTKDYVNVSYDLFKLYKIIAELWIN